jgi:hypothetical protein
VEVSYFVMEWCYALRCAWLASDVMLGAYCRGRLRCSVCSGACNDLKHCSDMNLNDLCVIFVWYCLMVLH